MSYLQDHIEAAAQSRGRPFSGILVLDLETRSELDVKRVGAAAYAEHHSTEIMCASWRLDGVPVQRWTETDPDPLLSVLPELTDPDILCVFHNAEFEPYILRECAGIEIEESRIYDSAAVARLAGLPGALEHLGAYLGFPKDTDGSRIMKKLSKPRKASKANPDKFWRPDTKPEDFDRLYAYCDQDVEVTQHALERIPAMTQTELRAYRATYRMNARGLPVDIKSARRLDWLVKETRSVMSAEIESEFGFTLSQPAKIAEFLGTLDCTKATIRDLLKDPFIPEDTRRVAEARQSFAKTSVDKIAALIRRTTEDGCLHGGVIYGGSERTLRFSGAGFQPMNLPRGLGEKQDLAFEALDAGIFDFVYSGEIIETISGIIRGLIARRSGRRLNVGDYSQIEARLLAWLVGDRNLLGAFARGEDPYRLMAAKIYDKAVELVTDSERFMGKQTVLGCGYGLGPWGFMGMLDTTYDVQIEKDEASSIVSAYRANAPEVREFWGKLDRALNAAHKKPGKELAIIPGKLSIKFTDEETFFLRLPSGRRLWYYQVEKKIAGYRISWTCYGRLKSGAGWGRVKIYGGALTGHIVQSTARDVIVNAMLELDARGHPLILTVHDELVELDDDRFDEFNEVMKTPPEWLTEFPLAVDTFQTERYRK